MYRPITRVLAVAVSSTFAFAPTPSLGFTVTVNGTAASSCQAPFVDAQGNITINCSTSSGSVCSVSASPTSVPSSGGTVTITASNCGTIALWTKSGTAVSQSSTQWQDTIPANQLSSSQTFTYTVNGTASASVTQAGAGSTAPPPGGNYSCTNIPGISSTKSISVAWAQSIGTGISTRGVGFGPADAVVFELTPPLGKTSNGAYGTFRTSPSDQNAYNTRIMSISATPCDFSRSMGAGSVVGGQEPTLYFSVGGYPKDKYGRTITTNANLTPGVKYYVTVIQESSVGGSNTCMSSVCNVDYGLTPGTN